MSSDIEKIKRLARGDDWNKSSLYRYYRRLYRATNKFTLRKNKGLKE